MGSNPPDLAIQLNSSISLAGISTPMEKQLSKTDVISTLTKSPHGKLEEYLPVGLETGRQQPEFLAHLVAWNQRKGQIRDAKVALPLISLATTKDPDFQDNALAHLAAQGPREFLRGIEFSYTQVPAGSAPARVPRRALRRLIERYLRDREAVRQFWDATAVNHRQTLKTLYSRFHIKPDTDFRNIVLYGRDLNKVKQPMPAGSVYAAIANLKNMPAETVLSTVSHFKIPFLVTKTALGARAKKEQDVALAIINSMTPNQLLANTKTLETWGIKTIPALRAAYADGLKRTASATNVQALKADKAAEVLREAGDEDLAAKLEAVSEKTIAKQMTVEGNWLVLADKSGSMSSAIEAARHVAGTLAKAVTGKVTLVFFDTMPRAFDVTGKTYEEIKQISGKVTADGGTSIGVGLAWAEASGLELDGIAIVSDGLENTPPYFGAAYKSYAKKFDKEPTVYFYKCLPGMHSYRDTPLNISCSQYGVQIETFDLGSNVDYYSLPNLVQTMRTNRYSLYDEIMDTPLLSLDAVLKNTKGFEVIKRGQLVTA